MHSTRYHPTNSQVAAISVPENLLVSWQGAVDLLAETLGVAAVLIVRGGGRKDAEFLVCNRTPRSVYHPGPCPSLGVGHYSGAVIDAGGESWVANALRDSRWSGGPDVELGMISYFGVPVVWPTGQIFGALGLVDLHEITDDGLSKRLLRQFQATVELGLKAVHDELILIRHEQEIEGLQFALDESQDGIEQRVRERTEKLNKANEALRESEARFRTLVDHAPEAMLVIDMDSMRFVDANNKVEQLLGLSREALLKTGPEAVSPLFQPDGRRSAEAALVHVAKAATEGVNVFDWVHCHVSGQEVLCEVRLARLPAAGRNLFRASIIDVTEQKRAEQALIQSENKYRTIFDNISEGLAFVDIDGRFLEVNPAYCQMLGYSKDEMSHMRVPEILHPDARSAFERFLSGILTSPAFKEELIHVHKSGRFIYAEVQGRAFKFNGKDCLLGVIRDITERKRAEAALKDSEEQVRLLLDSTAEAIYGLDLEGNCTFCNPSTLRLLGYHDQAELLGKNMHQLIHYQHTDGSSNPLEDCHACQAFRSGEGIHVKDEVFWRADGTSFPVEYRSFPIRKQGRMLGAVVTFLDITESKQAEQALAKSQNQFRSIFDNSAMGVLLLDLDGRLVTCNPAFCVMIGYSEDELTVMRFKDFTHPDDIPKSLYEFKELLGGGRDYYQFEKRYLAKNGRVVWARLTVSRVGSSDGLAGFVLAMVEDVTEQRLAEQALQQSEERYRVIFNNISDGLSVHDHDGRFLEVNPADCTMHGYTKEEMMALTVPEMVHRDCLNVFEEYKEAIEKTGFYQGEVTQFRKDGSVIHVEVKGTRITLDHKKYFLAIVRDITERKRTEAELNKYREHLEELVSERTVELAGSKAIAEAANSAKSVFLANMSHELRTPLNAILGFSQLLRRDGSLNDTPRKYLDSINRSGEHLLGLINDVLEVSKIETGRIVLKLVTFDFFALLDNVESIFQMETRKKRLYFRAERFHDLPRFLVGDEGKLRQVLLNLLGNAVKFTDAGGIAFRVSVPGALVFPTAKGAPTCWPLLLEVEDTGCGIAPEEMNKLFQPFEQTMSGQAKGGTGLGLAISREYACLMGGDICARSEPGRGSVFSFTCQLEEGCEEAVEKGGGERQVVGLAVGTGPKTILVVDDKHESRRFVAELVSLVGFMTTEATNGEEALALCRRQSPDLVLMDMRMPGMDGYEATRCLKASAPGVPIIAVSASALEEERERILATGVVELICKPFRENELLQAIGRILGIEYRYGDKLVVSPQDLASVRLIPEDLKLLPDALREELRSALLALNVEAIREIIGRIGVLHGPLAEALDRLEKEYQFEILLALLNH